MVHRRVILALLAPLLAGCHRYVPVAGTPLAAGDEVRLYLTPDGARALEPTLGPQTALVAGRVAAPDAAAPAAAAGVAGPTPPDPALALVVASTTKSYGATMRWIGERIVLPADAVAHGERRVLDRRRTALATAGIVVATAVGYALLHSIVGGTGGDDGSGGPLPVP